MRRLNMSPVICCILLHFLLASALGSVIPRIALKYNEISRVVFSKAGVSNYSTLLLSEKRGMLYVGAREVIFALNLSYIAEKIHEVNWTVSEQKQIQCKNKGKSKETECLNYIRILHEFNDEKLYVCGTFAFQPTCDYLTIKDFQLQGQNKEIRGQCPFDPAQRYTSVMVDGELYSGTVNNFLGSEPIITRGQLRTEYLLPWLNEPSFVYSDVIRESENNPDGDDDKIYFFFNEVAVEYEFNGKLKMPRIARVCKGDQGGSRTLQKRWTSFLKAKLICHLPESNFVFNIVHDVFILKTPNWKETIFYGVFTSQWSNLGMSAVCAFNMSSVEDVFSKGKYMQSAAFEHSHVKWVRYSGQVPTPRPGSCMNNEARAQKINSSLHLPDKTLQFVKDHPLMEDPVNPIGNGPKLVKRNVNYKQIVVDRVRALDNSLNDVLFVATDTGLLHKAINYDNEMHIIEEIQLFPNSEPVQTLLLASERDNKFLQDNKFLYAGSDSGVVQVPVAFCEKYKTCTDCILARDPYCAWNPESNSCIWVRKGDMRNSNLMQNLKGDAVPCIAEDGKFLHTPEFKMEPGGFKELKCHLASRLATVVWKFNNESLNDGLKYRLYRNNLLILQLSKRDSGVYECWTMEDVKGNRHEHLVERYSLSVEPLSEAVTAPPTTSFTQAEASPVLPFTPLGSSSPSLGSDPPPSPAITPSGGSSHDWSSVDSTVVQLLAPLLSDQTHTVCSPGSVHLFCQAIGFSDLHFIWERNGQKVTNSIKDQSQALRDGRMHVLSWLKDTITADTEYQCCAVSRRRNVVSKVLIVVEDALIQKRWSKELAKWKKAVDDHEQMMQAWTKSWGSCEHKNLQ
ncbi:semaphorin-4D isoform X3 [Callorhinchus milii]|uniref:semaphorin-4D isoform X3 n=1 Tax=Callorhinchus milii TaxID=7868 RepID=UPI0004571551|nr:semaphorin-4D isoform X3 [Callorhinchus milii]|eukprot:gi/632964022/ref/XP_007898196.1/ PREDICTED: semaphorin-4D isoform X2 [Callorhinchus milii]